MEGLEICEVLLSDVRGEDESFRFDSEFFRKDDINRLRQLGLLSHSSLIELSRRIDVGYVGEMTSEYTTDATAPKLIQTRNIDEFIPNDTDIIHISQEFHEQLQKSQIHTNDILLARSGSFGNAAIWLDKETVNSSDIIIIDVDPSKIDPCYLVAFLNSRYGRFQLDRYASGAVQRHVNLTILERLNIALLSEDVRSFVGSLVRQAFKTITDSRACYRAAEDKLLKDLGFLNWSPVDGGVSVKPFSEVANACRIDAEYFQPKFDEINVKIRSCSNKVVCASEILVEGLCKSNADQEERYVELADIGSHGTIESCTQAKFSDLPSRARQRIAQGQVIVSSIEGSLKSCALVTGEYDGALCSTGFHRFQSAEINPETLLLLFKSWPIQEQLKRGCSGTILSGISSTSLSDVVLPVLPQDIQLSLAEKVRESFRLRQESKRLLNLAKSAVEKAIEDGENSALKMLKEEVS